MKPICSMVLILASALTTNVVASQTRALEITSTRDLAKYVGTYPCTNGLLKQPILLSSLKQILHGDYDAYSQHMKFSGCGAIERRDGFLLMDVSQLHVGGYTSLIFVRVRDGALFLFWLKSTVAQKEYSFYGQKPIPAAIDHIVESELNTTWGHVAKFHVHGENVQVELVARKGACL